MFRATDTLPSSLDLFLLADFIEFKTIIHPDRCFSRSDFVGVVKANTDGNRNIKNPELAWHDTVSFIGNRSIEFNDAYPFKMSENSDTVFLDYNDKLQQNFYIFLLLASSMRFILSQKQHIVARTFEMASLEVFRQIMPADSEVRPTWAGGGTASSYTGTLFEKMKKIAYDIRCTPNFKEEDFKESNTGDGGIDIIAWHPMEDNREGIPIAFAQCGCSTTDWTYKQLEASPATHLYHFPVIHPWANYYFLPLDLRRPDGDWGCKDKIRQAIVVDRLRISRLAKRYGLYNSEACFSIVCEALQFRD